MEARFAELLAAYCLEAQSGETVLVEAETPALPLLPHLKRALLRRGAYPLIRLSYPGEERDFLLFGGRWLEEVPEAELALYQRADKFLRVLSAENPLEAAAVDPALALRRQRAWRLLQEIRHGKRWALTLHPTVGYAVGAGMGTEEFRAYLERALFLDREDPVAAWQELSRFQEGLIRRLSAAKELRILAPGTDLRLSVAGRTWVNSDGRRNMPSGEVFTGPVEDSAEGEVRLEGSTRWVRMTAMPLPGTGPAPGGAHCLCASAAARIGAACGLAIPQQNGVGAAHGRVIGNRGMAHLMSQGFERCHHIALYARFAENRTAFAMDAREGNRLHRRHAERLAHVLLPVDDEFLGQHMQDLLVGRNVDRLRGLDHAGHDGQPQPCAVGVAGALPTRERLEQPLPDPLVDARPGIVDEDADRVAVALDQHLRHATGMLLESLGHHVELQPVPYDYWPLMRAYTHIVATQTAAFFDAIAPLVGRAATAADMAPFYWSLCQYGRSFSGVDHSNHVEQVRMMSRECLTRMAAFDMWLMPTVPMLPRSFFTVN